MYREMLGGKYCGNIPCIMGKHPEYSDYIRQFAQSVTGHGLDIGAGPDGYFAEMFNTCQRLDGCDIDEEIVKSLPSQSYSERFIHALGREKLQYKSNSLDFVICSCVFHHLTFAEIQKGIAEMVRVLKVGGLLLLAYKAGNNETTLTHFHASMGIYYSFTVYDPKPINELLSKNGTQIIKD